MRVPSVLLGGHGEQRLVWQETGGALLGSGCREAVETAVSPRPAGGRGGAAHIHLVLMLSERGLSVSAWIQRWFCPCPCLVSHCGG